MNNEIKLCKDCQHFRRAHPISTRLGTCLHPKALDRKDYVNGKDTYHSAEYMRENRCGSDAKLFLAEDLYQQNM